MKLLKLFIAKLYKLFIIQLFTSYNTLQKYPLNPAFLPL